ncbi:MAG: hypothetical protein KHZ09_14555, partial [Clostridium sp.]|uniref:MATE family efflux transporter n=1 Tax=Clostridium sp. TaxID=1506 RepID=UPI001D723561
YKKLLLVIIFYLNYCQKGVDFIQFTQSFLQNPIQCFPTQIISLFNNDPELTTLAIKGIRIYLLMMPVVGINIVATSYYQSIGKAKISMFVSLLRQVILLIPFTIILPKFIGLDGVWAAGACADSLSVIITLVLLKKEFKQLDKMQLEKIA